MLNQRKTTQDSYFKRPQSLRFSGCLIASCALPILALAADNPGAHEHGQAQLQMALEDNRIDLIFTSPAYNLAGFEHQAHTDDEKKRLTKINNWLETTPLINTGTGACSLTAASVQLGGESGSHHESDHHEEGHHDDQHRADEKTHRDYEVTQQLNCEGIDGSDTLTSALPERFPELEELKIEWVGPAGQGSALVTSSIRTFRLSE